MASIKYKSKIIPMEFKEVLEILNTLIYISSIPDININNANVTKFASVGESVEKLEVDETGEPVETVLTKDVVEPEGDNIGKKEFADAENVAGMRQELLHQKLMVEEFSKLEFNNDIKKRSFILGLHSLVILQPEEIPKKIDKIQVLQTGDYLPFDQPGLSNMSNTCIHGGECCRGPEARLLWHDKKGTPLPTLILEICNGNITLPFRKVNSSNRNRSPIRKQNIKTRNRTHRRGGCKFYKKSKKRKKKKEKRKKK